MASTADAGTHKKVMLVLAAAVVQGWALYGLHESIKAVHWPATDSAWLLALYAVAVFVPLTFQLLVAHAGRRQTWEVLAGIALSFFYFGWHHGSAVMDRTAERFVSSGDWFPMVFVLLVLWLLLLPFAQARVTGGRWRTRYELLFSSAWNNKLVLAEAVLFTGLFWLLLILWQQLFAMLGIGFFKELFEEPIFIYPVTTLVFGIALHLIGSLERLTHVILEQLLNVLKWLALLACLILALFTVALAMKLPGMISSGERAISAAWLLWLVAVTVLLLNAAYRDGTVERPYPQPIALALRLAVPLVVVVALTAIYALYVRIDVYGFTVERVWASIVASAACLYAIGYALASRRKVPWMAGMARVNVIAALFLIGLIALALTPVLSPYRIAANSQYRLAQDSAAPSAATQRGYDTPLQYLRFQAGRYGLKRLEELASLEGHPRAQEIRSDAAAMITQKERYFAPLPTNVKRRISEIKIYPATRALEQDLKQKLEADLINPNLTWSYANSSATLLGLFIELNGSEPEEFVLIADNSATAYRLDAGQWKRAAWLESTTPPNSARLARELASGNASTKEPTWKELTIGPFRYRVTGEED